MASTYVAQSPPILEKIKGIRLLESTREGVTRILAGDSEFITETPLVQYFSLDKERIKVEYSTGQCSDEGQEWNVPHDRATALAIFPKDAVSIKDLGINYTRFRKQRIDPQRKRILVFYDKPAGIAIEAFGTRVSAIYIFPGSVDYPKLCDKKDVREYFASRRWTRNPIFKNSIIDYSFPANVVEVILTPMPADLRKFEVVVSAEDPENDILTYNYKITAGRIIGTGKRVIWDLAGVGTGTYKITAAVDDGCGICGKYISKTVDVQ
jgi:hypothetical protein